MNVRSACKDKNGNEKPHFVSKMRSFKSILAFLVEISGIEPLTS